jgi:hypothetical protein
MAGFFLLLAVLVIAYLVDRFGPQRNVVRKTNILHPAEIPAAIATKRGLGLGIIDLAFVGVLLAFYPKHYWLIIFYGVLGYTFLVAFAHRVINKP